MLDIKINGKEVKVELLNILEFTNVRKRMSVIVKMPDGKITLFCKGADTVIYERLGPNQPYANITREHLDVRDHSSLCKPYCRNLHQKDFEPSAWQWLN